MKPVKHDDMCPCTRFRAQPEFCTCGAEKVAEIVSEVSSNFAYRLRTIMRPAAPAKQEGGDVTSK